MRKFIWLLAAIVCLVVAAAVWWYMSNPEWVVGLVAAAVASIYNALAPKLFKRMPPDKEKKWRLRQLRGEGK